MFSGTVPRPRPAARRPATASGRSPRSASSTAARPSGARRSPPGRSASSGASATSGSATRSASPRTSRGAPPLRPADAGDRRRSAPPRRPGRAARRAHPARRAGPADQPAPGRRPRRRCSSRSTARCRRRSSRRRWPSDFGIEVELPRDDHASASNGRSAPARPSRSCDTDANPFLATVGLRVEPAPVGSRRASSGWRSSSARCRSRSSRRSRRPCTETLRQGLHGWQVTDCVVTMTHSGYWPRQSHAHATFDKSMSSTAGDFRNLTPLVLMDALQAGRHQRCTSRCTASGWRSRPTRSAPCCPCWRGCAPCRRPRRCAGRRACWRARSRRPGCTSCEQQLPALTRGEGVLECAFDRYQPVRGAVPDRPRTDHNPLNRKEYLLHVVRGVTGR